MAARYQRLGDVLINKRIITFDQLQTALQMQREQNRKLGEILIELGLVSEHELIEVLEEQMGIPFVELEREDIRIEVPNLITEKMARRHVAIPYGIEDQELKVAMADPLNIIAIKDIKLATGMEVRPFMSTKEHVFSAIDQFYSKAVSDEVYEELSSEFNLEELEELDENLLAEINNAPIVKLVNSIFEQAVKLRASDIHIEPYDKEIRVRYRIDGELIENVKPSKAVHSAIVTRIKIMANLNIAERRLPQDGRIELEVNNHMVDLRISILPTIHGEKVVIRLLDRSNQVMTKKELGFSDENLEKFDKVIKSPNGIFLVTGPTGSGKTTTLYAALMELNDVAKNIITVEDPVEYRMGGINQTQVNTKAGLTFASGLRSILRQDPDIIMIGEIRDAETAQIAVRAAITGHLVLSTVHTNDTASTVARLVDMGIEPYLITSSVVGILAQRLVKKVCDNCKVAYPADYNEAILLEVPEGTNLYKGTGCGQCNHTGYKGRTAIHEILPVTKRVKQAIDEGKNTEEIKTIAIDEGMTTLRQSARALVIKGVTSMEELLRMTYSIE